MHGDGGFTAEILSIDSQSVTECKVSINIVLENFENYVLILNCRVEKQPDTVVADVAI